MYGYYSHFTEEKTEAKKDYIIKSSIIKEH